MKTETNSISIEISRKEALSIFNALNKSLDLADRGKSENEGAKDLKDLLQSNFFSSVSGVHCVR